MRRTPIRLSTLPPTLRSILSTHRPTPSSSTTTAASSTTPSDNDEVTINGWIKSIRTHKNVSFVEVNDGSSSEGVQAVLKGKGRSEGLTNGTSVQLKGRLGKSRGQGQDLELLVNDLRVLGDSDPEAYPIQKKSLPASVLRDNAHLRFRTTQTASVMRIRDALQRDWHDWFEENGFTHIHTPLLTGSDCEGAGEVFTLVDQPSTSKNPPPFFPHPVHLTVSSQLHLEAPTHSLSRTYTLSPSFRAEPSLTSRHLSEFYMLEAEVAWVETLDGLLDVVEDGVKNSVGRILAEQAGGRGKRVREDLEVISKSLAVDLEQGPEVDINDTPALNTSDPLGHLRQVLAKPFTRITYTSALDLIRTTHETEEGLFTQSPPQWGEGIATEFEKWLAIHFGGPVFVTHYPADIKPFYMLPSESNSTLGPTVECFDLLFPHLGEMAGGSLREHRLPNLISAIEKAGMKREEYDWYLDLRRYGSVPHGGWGMGWDRWVCWVTGVGNVRDVVPFPRWKGHCKY
ncbi:asparagine-tRNA ligase [Kwoniella shandongensis]|uniref:asparagine--tRNA ligase n=1 Tax=Kwoniella shandongensis TaxID=1734106 RepID=A0A5M6C8C7_9TREE|nr:asparagine-tRNA ligase [Kwoniella shandongensis]KAA5531344.1 asparagine-tRNA ligase [Kwoniella shandongensis]